MKMGAMTQKREKGAAQADRNSRHPLRIVFGTKAGRTCIQLGSVMTSVITQGELASVTTSKSQRLNISDSLVSQSKAGCWGALHAVI